MVEIDVRPTADGELVVFHDDTLKRLTDAPADIRDRPVWELTYETLRSFDILGTGERIPRLSAVLEAVPSTVRLNIEFKNPGTDKVRFAENLSRAARESARDRWIEFVRQVHAVIDDAPHDVLVSSFFEGALAATREIDPAVPLAWIFYESVVDGLEVARRYDCEAIHLPWSMLPGTSLFNEPYTGQEPYDAVDFVELANEEDRELNAWTVDNWHQAAELHRLGVDGIITDVPRLFHYFGSGPGLDTPASHPPSRASD